MYEWIWAIPSIIALPAGYIIAKYSVKKGIVEGYYAIVEDLSSSERQNMLKSIVGELGASLGRNAIGGAKGAKMKPMDLLLMGGMALLQRYMPGMFPMMSGQTTEQQPQQQPEGGYNQPGAH